MVSPGCTNCYAMRLAGTRLRHHPSRTGLTQQTKAGHVWTGEVRFNEQWIDQPFRWKRPRDIFVCAHGDLFRNGQGWGANLTWDEMQRLKSECGRSNRWAVEVFPPSDEVVNVANMRHLWLLPGIPPYGWSRHRE